MVYIRRAFSHPSTPALLSRVICILTLFVNLEIKPSQIIGSLLMR
jgi:hypothetical protein